MTVQVATEALIAQREAYVAARAGYALNVGNSWVDFHTGFELGWDAARAPVTVSSIAELDALPVGSVVQSVKNGLKNDVWQRLAGGWVLAGYFGFQRLDRITFPATVLWVGEVATNDQ